MTPELPRNMLDGDRVFTGWSAALSPESLPTGKLALSINNRMRSGAVERRGGYRKTGWWHPERYPFHGAGAANRTGTLSAGASGTLVTEIWSDPDTGITHTATRRNNYRVDLDSGPAFPTDLFSDPEVLGWPEYYILWEGGLIQRIVSRVNGSTVIVSDFQSCAIDPDPGEAFAIAAISYGPVRHPDLQAAALIHAGYFSDPNGLEWDLRMTEDACWLSREGWLPWSVPIGDGGIAPGDPVFLLQCFERLLLFRGEGKAVLEWDGDPETGFDLVPEPFDGYLTPDGEGEYVAPDGEALYVTPDGDDYTRAIPGARRALFFANRVWVGFARDSIAVSDVASYTRYDYLQNEFRLNDGTSDELVALHPYGKRAILAFFRRSIYLLENVFGALDQLTARRISTAIGCGGADTICDIGDDVWWVDADGQLWSISQVNDDRMELAGRPLSWQIRPDMGSQSVGRVSEWRAAYHDGLFFLATRKASGAGGPVYVYDTILQDWVSRDLIEPADYPDDGGMPPCLGLVRMEAYGESRLLYQTDYHSLIVGFGDTDNTIGREYCIRQHIRTRAVVTLPLETKRGHGARFQARTLNPYINAAVLGEGVGQRQALLANKEFNRLRYTAWGKEDYNPAGIGGYLDPHREDYLVRVNDGLRMSADGSPLHINPLQEWRMAYPIRALFESLQLDLVNGRPHDLGPLNPYPYPWTSNLPTAITLVSWRIEATLAGAQQYQRT
jgi:hypothetical protein